MDEQRRRCMGHYRLLREDAKAPVMISFKTAENSYYVEAKDGSWPTDINQEHCSWCAKGTAVIEWTKKQKQRHKILGV